MIDKKYFYIIPICLIISLIFILLFVHNPGEDSSEAIKIKGINTDSEQSHEEREIHLDNPRYENADLKANFKDRDIQDNIVNFTLRSHPNVNHVKKVGAGNQVVMYYDVASVYQLENALNDPIFIDMRTGEEVERDWRYVVWGEETREVEVCSETSFSGNGTEYCSQWDIENQSYETWIPYSSRDIPNGQFRIGIEVKVLQNDYVDGIWKVGGKSIDKHAVWEASLETDLISWYGLNETSGSDAGDYLGNNTGTYNGDLPTAIDGANPTITNNSQAFDNAGDYMDTGITFNVNSDNSFTILFRTNDTSGNIGLAGDGIAGNNDRFWLILKDGGKLTIGTQSGGTSVDIVQGTNDLRDGEWHSAIFTFNTSSNVWELWENGQSLGSAAENPTNFGGGIRIGVDQSQAVQGRKDIDEVGIASRLWTDEEISTIYNDGNYCTFGLCDSGLIVNLISPEDNVTLGTTTNNFTWNVSDLTSFGIENSTIRIFNSSGLVYNFTNSSGVDGDYLHEITLNDGNYSWNVTSIDSTNKQQFNSSTRSFTIDSIEPVVTILYPTGNIYHKSGENLTLNFTISEENLDSCWYNWNGTNVTINDCSLNTTNIQNVNDFSNTDVTLYANDTFGNLNSTTSNWNYTVFETNRTFNSSTFETKGEGFILNFSTLTTPTSAELIHNGTTTSATITDLGSDQYSASATKQIPLGPVNNTFFFNVTGVNEVSTDESTQETKLLVFTIFNSTYNETALNVTFKDENDLSTINATIPSSDFIYYVGDGTINKTFSYTNNTENPGYRFVTNYVGSLNVNPLLQYRNSPNYPQRIWDPVVQQYDKSNPTDQILYLLHSDDGIFVTFQVINNAEQPISGVNINATREISGSDVIVGTGETDAAGSLTLFLNPDFSHDFCFAKSGLDTLCTSFFPTQSSYTISLGSDIAEEDDYSQGVSWIFSPKESWLSQNQVYNFTFSISSTFWSLDSAEISLLFGNGTSIGSDSLTTSTGGTLRVLNVNVSNSTSVVMKPSYVIDGNTVVIKPIVWQIQNTAGSEYSIWNFFTNLNSHLDDGLLGINDFGKSLLTVLFLIIVVGTLSYRYGIRSDAAIGGVIFAVVFLLDVGLGFIPEITLGTEGAGVTINSGIITALTLLILVALAIREERR